VEEGYVVAMNGAHAEELLADLDRAIIELEQAATREPGLWERGAPGKWSAGEHVAHIVATMAESAEGFEDRVTSGGSVPRHPRRGPLQWLWVHLVIAPGRLPRGGQTAPRFVPTTRPERGATLEALHRVTERHAGLTRSLSVADRDRLWIPNPFLPQWHYTLPEMLRVHAVHARHHAKLVAEIA
jgi:hypothetical protein